MNQKTLWMVTGVVAVLMIAGALWIARQRAATLSVPDLQPVIRSESEPVAPMPQLGIRPVAPATSETPQPQPEAPVVYDEVMVDLSKIAGKLKMNSPHIPSAGAGRLPRYPLDLTCHRKNYSPALNWSGAPAGVKSYVLALERRARGEKASWTWIMYNIPASSTSLPGKISSETWTQAQGMFGTNSYGHQSYTGPCEPRGAYPFILRLFALDTELSLPPGATLEDILPAMNGHVLDSAEIRTEHYLLRI